MTIAYDNTWLDPQPVRWDMRRVLTVGTILGLIGVAETFGILVIARQWLHLDHARNAHTGMRTPKLSKLL